MTIIRDERIGGQWLILGDCREVLPLIGKVDAVLTDPPYGISEGAGLSFSGSKRGSRKPYDYSGWDEARPPRAVFDAMREGSDHQIIWGGNYFADLLPPSRRWLVWDKGQRLSQSDGELAWTSQDAALRIIEKNRVALLIDGAAHPTQKPVALMEWCLGFLPNAQTILDPFMGSGTTLVTCQRQGRSGIGIEIDPDYFAIACKRVDEESRQPRMFVEPLPKPQQEQLL